MQAMALRLLHQPPVRYAGAVFLSVLPFLVVGLAQSRFYVVLDTAPYLVFHNVAELFSVLVSFSIFGIGWFSYAQSRDRHGLFLAALFLGIGLLDLIHTLGYKGMPPFITPNETNKATEFWLAARSLTALGFLASAFVTDRKAPWWLAPGALLSLALVVPVAVFTAVTYFPAALPAAFVDGVGLTPFKKGTEYVIVLLLVLAMGAYARRMVRTKDPLIPTYLAAFFLCIVTELAFTVYQSAFDTYNMLGHLYKVVAFVLIYRAVFLSSVRRPYERLQTTLAEKETLLRELYHRTKNTLQMVRSLLVLQASEAGADQAVTHLVEKTEQRLQAISLVHEKLYTSRDLSRISLGEFVDDLVNLLLAGYGPDRNRIKTVLSIEERALLLDTAVPFGLVLGELVTNSLKYAFPGGRTGTIWVTLTEASPGRIRFRYADDGVGLPPEVDLEHPDSLGLTLVRTIGVQQLKGQVILAGTGGFSCSIDFPDNLYQARV